MTRRFPALAALAVPALALAQSSPVSPGLWEVAVTINSVSMPGGPAMVARMMTGRTTRVKHCITPADAAKGPQELLKANKSCTFTRYQIANGRLDSAMTCTQGGQTTTSTSTGTFTAGSFSATGRSVTTGSMPMTMTSSSTGRLLGSCR